MPELFLTPASLSSFNQTLLALFVTLYLAWDALARRSPRRGQRLAAAEAWLLIFFAGLTLFSGLSFWVFSSAPSSRLAAVYLQNTLLAATLLALIQFAYHFPVLPPAWREEARLAWLLCGAYTLWEASFAVQRFAVLPRGQVLYRPEAADFTVVMLVIWLIVLFVRQARQRRGEPDAACSRNFALIFLLPLLAAVSNLLLAYGLVTLLFDNIVFSVTILLAIFFFSANYLEARAAYTSFIVRLAGGLLTAMLVILGVLAWIITPAYADRYDLGLPEQRALRFVPNARGGYDASEVPYHFEPPGGQKLALAETDPRRQSQPLAFEFPFFGQTAGTIYVTNDCALGIGQDLVAQDLEFHYGAAPGIFPLYLDYNPDLPGAAIFARQEADRLVITCQDLPAYHQPQQRFNLQTVLYRSGAFEIRYGPLPVGLHFAPDGWPEASPWFLGVKPGSEYPGAQPQPVEMVHFSRPPREGHPSDGAPSDRAPSDRAPIPGTLISGGPTGMIQDEFLAARRYLSDFLEPMMAVVLSASLLLVLALPLLLRYSLLDPLNSLLRGIQQANTAGTAFSSAATAGGSAAIHPPLPIKFRDEIGFLTGAFNQLYQDFDRLVASLEERVDQRTTDLTALNERLRKLSRAVEQSPSSIIITDHAGGIEYVNPAFTRATGYTLPEIAGQTPRLLKSRQTSPGTYQQLWQTITSGETWRGELLNRRKNGELFWEYTVIAPIYNDARQISHFVAVKEEISTRKSVEQALVESEKRYRDLFDLESDALFIIRNEDGQILEANNAASMMYGFSIAELLQMHNTDLSAEPQETRQATTSTAPPDQIISIPLRWHRHKDGTVFPVEITARFIFWKGQSVHLAAIRDITERRQAEQELLRLAITDPLTGLFNRRHFFTRSGDIFARAKHPPGELAALMIDIDHFKSFNDRYGHAIGDLVLCEVGRCLAENLRATDVLARYGGEEFSVLLPRTDSHLACHIASRLLAAISGQPLELRGITVSITISIGVAMLTAEVADMDELMLHADQALYQAKQQGRNRWVRYEKISG